MPKKELTAIDFYKFVNGKGLEFHWNEGKTEVKLFVPCYLIDDFNRLINHQILDDPLECWMLDNYLCFPTMYEFLENNDIDPKEIFDPTI